MIGMRCSPVSLVADRGGGGVAVELGHLAVHEDRVVGAVAEALEHLAAVLGDVGGDVALGQHALDHEAVDRVVVGDEDPRVDDQRAGTAAAAAGSCTASLCSAVSQAVR